MGATSSRKPHTSCVFGNRVCILDGQALQAGGNTHFTSEGIRDKSTHTAPSHWTTTCLDKEGTGARKTACFKYLTQQ